MRCELNFSVHTVSAYKRDLEQWREFITGGQPEVFDAQKISTSYLRLWVTHLKECNLSATTIRRKVQSLRAFYKYLNRYHSIEKNPAAELSTAKISKSLPTYIRPEETYSIFSADWDRQDFVATRDRLILLMFYTTGMRCTELETLADVNVDTFRLELKVHGKRNKERIIPFGKELCEVINIYRTLRNDIISQSIEYFFVRPTGEPLYRRMIYNIVHRQLADAGVHCEKLSPHVLRHSFATDMLNNGADITAVQKLLGHESLATTQVYTHTTYRELKLNYQHAHPRALKKGG